MPQYTLTALYALAQNRVRDFDAFRTQMGVPLYFCSEGSHLAVYSHGNDFYLDQADLSRFDLAFLLGAQATRMEGIRLSLPFKMLDESPDCTALEQLFPKYTFWPNSHLLAPASHAVFAFVHEFVEKVRREVDGLASEALENHVS